MALIKPAKNYALRKLRLTITIVVIIIEVRSTAVLKQ
jgi:hypothetical protein